MNARDKELAEEAELPFHGNNPMWSELDYDQKNKMLERFADLIREDATEKANARANTSWALMCEKMVAAEREKFCAALRQLHDSYSLASNLNNIRAKSNK